MGEEGRNIDFTEIFTESTKRWSLVGKLPYSRKRWKQGF